MFAFIKRWLAKREAEKQRRILIFDRNRWLAEKLVPEIYGEKLDVNTTLTIDIGDALAKAREKVAGRKED